MSFDLSKLSATFAQIDAAEKRFDLGGLGDMSAALGAVDRIGAGLERIDAFGVGADLAGMRGAEIGSLASHALSAGLGETTGLGISEAKLTPLGRGLSALGGRSDEGWLSAAAGLAKPPSWTEEPSWMKSMPGVLEAAEKATKPGILDGLGGADKWRGFGVSASLAGTPNLDLWALDSARWGLDAGREPSSFGIPGTLGDYGRGWTGAASSFGAGGLTGAGGSGILDGLFEPFEGIGEIARKAFGFAELLKPYWDGWARIAEEAIRTAQRIAAQPARPGDELLAFAAYDALEAMQEGRHWVAARFLEQSLNLRATPERLEALWIFLKRGFERPVSSPPLWLTLEGRKARAYLATAVYRGEGGSSASGKWMTIFGAKPGIRMATRSSCGPGATGSATSRTRRPTTWPTPV